MAASVLHHDLETRSAIDLNQCGQYTYAMAASTKILMCSWAIDDGKISTWYPFLGEPMPKELEDAMCDPEVELGAHNASFERILQVTAPARPQRFLPDKVVKAIRPLRRWNCTAARAAYMGLPRSLEKAALALNLPINKDIEGKKLMLKMCKPTGRALNGSYLWHMNDADLFREGQYCEQDVAVERRIHDTIPELPSPEREVWEATERMNDRGVQVDSELLLAMTMFVVEAEHRVNRNIKEYTNGIVPKVTNSKKMLEWVHAQGFTHLPSGAPVKGVGKDVIRDLLANDGLPEVVREVLLTRQEGNKSSSSKYKAVLQRLNNDGRIRGSIVYCGAASTHRFSSRGAQLQNLPRGGAIKNIDAALEAVLNGASPDQIATDFGAPMIVASELVRPTFVSPKNMWMARGDYAQVELRAGAFLAGQNNALQGFRDYDTIIGFDERGKPKRKGPDRYRVTAAGIFQVPVSEIDDSKRQGGKIGDLACIAKGSLVTTDQGLVPIELVTTAMRVWDGVEWVHHEGVISRGIKEVISYEGLTATPDHLVFPAGEEVAVPFGQAARSRVSLVRSETPRAGFRAGGSNQPPKTVEHPEEPCVRRSSMPNLPMGELDQPPVTPMWQEQRLPELLRVGQWPVDHTHVASKTYGGGASTLYQPKRPSVQKLWGSGGRVSVLVTTCRGFVGDRKLGARKEKRNRPDRQQWALRTGEPEVVLPAGAVPQPEKNQNTRGSNVGEPLRTDNNSDVVAEGINAGTDNREGLGRRTRPQKGLDGYRGTSEVFDIINAGPRHRFVVSGCLVHNCGFGGGKGAFQAFAKIYNFNVSDSEAQGIVDGWRAANPYVVQFWQDLEDNAIACMKARPGTRFVIQTIRNKPKYEGRPINSGLWFIRGRNALVLRLPSGNCLFYWYPKLEKKETPWGEAWQVTYMAEDSQTKLWKRWSMWGGILCENAVQSFARDIMARAIVRMDKAGLDPVLTVHDEGIGQIPFSMAPTAEEAAELVRREMLATEVWYEKMPLAVDASAAPRYAKA